MPTNAAGASWLAASVGAYGLALVLRGWRWHRILRLSRIPHERADAFLLMLVAYMGNTVLPLRGGEVLRISLLASRANARVREVLGTVIAERTLDVATLAVIFVVLTLAGVDGAPTGKIAAYVAAGLVLLAAVGLVGYSPFAAAAASTPSRRGSARMRARRSCSRIRRASPSRRRPGSSGCSRERRCCSSVVRSGSISDCSPRSSRTSSPRSSLRCRRVPGTPARTTPASSSASMLQGCTAAPPPDSSFSFGRSSSSR